VYLQQCCLEVLSRLIGHGNGYFIYQVDLFHIKINENIRYYSGISALIWTCFWFFFVVENPATHSTISAEEVAYIEANLVHPSSRVENIFFFFSKLNLFCLIY